MSQPNLPPSSNPLESVRPQPMYWSAAWSFRLTSMSARPKRVDVASADVVGFWRRDDARAVMTTACGDVKRTAYVVDGGALVVVGVAWRVRCVDVVTFLSFDSEGTSWRGDPLEAVPVSSLFSKIRLSWVRCE